MTQETTEWQDILVKKGIIEATESQIVDIIEQVIDEKQNLNNKTLDELDELEDDLEDDRIIQQYRQKRISEMKAQSKTHVFGSILHLSKPDYTIQVTEASQSVWVIVFLYQDYLPSCKLALQHLNILVKLHQRTKFCKMIASSCIENYPDRNCPTLLVYGNGELQLQLVPNTFPNTVESLEDVLLKCGAIESIEYKPTDSDQDSDQD